MPNHDRRNLLWAAAALLALLPLALGPGTLGRLWGVDGGRRRAGRRPEAPADPRPRIALPAGSVRRHD
jgi:hypothetical protein